MAIVHWGNIRVLNSPSCIYFVLEMAKEILGNNKPAVEAIRDVFMKERLSLLSDMRFIILW